jgi:hypothetical protein
MRDRPTHCKYGHAFDSNNTRVRKNGSYACKARLANRSAKYREKAKASNALRREEKRKDWTREFSDRELSWAAGLFEGEGTVTIATGGASRLYTRLVVTLSSTDEEIVAFFQDRWPGTITTRLPPGNTRMAYTWFLSAWRAQVFIEQVLPFVVTTRVRAKMELAIEAQSTKQQGTRKNCIQYREEQETFRLRMKALNKRGAAPLLRIPAVARRDKSESNLIQTWPMLALGLDYAGGDRGWPSAMTFRKLIRPRLRRSSNDVTSQAY